jgi:solute carrier family 44 (choline transporter-like protein), member 2/4/5
VHSHFYSFLECICKLYSYFLKCGEAGGRGKLYNGHPKCKYIIIQNWRWLILALILSVVLSIIFMFFLRCFAGCFVWVSLFLVVGTLLGLAIVFLYNGGAISRDSFIGNLGISIPKLPTSQYYNIFGYITFGVAAIILLIILCCCGRIRLAVALCGIAGKFIAETCQIIVVPIIMGFFVFALWVAGIFSMVCLIGTATFVVNGNDVFTSIQSYTSSSLGYFYYTVFGTLWMNALLLAITVFVIAAACSIWYFSKGAGS